jgi:hypothetical protein
MKKKTNPFSDKGKLRDCVNRIFMLKEWLKETLKYKEMIALSLEHYKELKKKEWVQILHCPFPS